MQSCRYIVQQKSRLSYLAQHFSCCTTEQHLFHPSIFYPTFILYRVTTVMGTRGRVHSGQVISNLALFTCYRALLHFPLRINKVISDTAHVFWILNKLPTERHNLTINLLYLICYLNILVHVETINCLIINSYYYRQGWKWAGLRCWMAHLNDQMSLA